MNLNYGVPAQLRAVLSAVITAQRPGRGTGISEHANTEGMHTVPSAGRLHTVAPVVPTGPRDEGSPIYRRGNSSGRGKSQTADLSGGVPASLSVTGI